MSSAAHLLAQVRKLPLIAILRGLTVEDALEVGNTLYLAGFRILEVPLNRPDAIECIAALAHGLPDDALIGGGTILTEAHLNAVHAAGGRLMVSPNCSPAVIRRAVALDMLAVPGVATPTEAFTALTEGAHALKLFPAESLGYGGLKALKSVIPAETDLWPVGGITPESIAPWFLAGATGFGIGSQLFSSGVSATQLQDRATTYVKAWTVATS
jgi:2-dehydro-3-deoxyphosphogalactonate aldolase